jgi:hypothetical protein
MLRTLSKYISKGHRSSLKARYLMTHEPTTHLRHARKISHTKKRK